MYRITIEKKQYVFDKIDVALDYIKESFLKWKITKVEIEYDDSL
jgi:hypothetical protein